MTTTNDPDLYRDRWTEHVDELDKLKLSLPPERFDEVDECKEKLSDLIDAAASDFDAE